MVIISFMNKKGGVGKTTSAINLAYLASLKYKTLIVDADSQGNLSSNFGIDEPKTSINNLFLGEAYEIYNIRENLDLIPSTIDFTGIDLKIHDQISRELILQRALSKFENDYEYVFIDCLPRRVFSYCKCAFCI